MSYDVSIGEFSGNYTYNVSRLFHDHVSSGECTGLQALDGLTGKQACAVLADAFDRIHKTKIRLWQLNDVGEPAFCARYDAENGWGSAVGGLIFLGQIFAACALNPRKKVMVW